MNIAAFSIKRPIFITSIVLLMLATGWFSLKKMGVDLFPDVNIPVITVSHIYTGANPEEIESLISKPLESELSSISGLKRIRSINQEGYSIVVLEFYLSTDIKDAEQQVRNRVQKARAEFPNDVDESVIRRVDPADQPVMKYSLSIDLKAAKMNEAELFDLTNEEIKPLLEQVPAVGSVSLIGGVRREIQIELDRDKLNQYEISAIAIANALKNYGLNVPVGKKETGNTEITYRTIGQFENLKQIEDIVISFGGDYGSFVSLKQVAKVKDLTEDYITKGFLYAPLEIHEEKEKGMVSNLFSQEKPKNLQRVRRNAIFIDIFKQSGENTVAVADGIKKKIIKINQDLANRPGKPQLSMVFDGSKWVEANIDEVNFSIILGIILTVIVVYFFLGSFRSTIITGLAIPNSLIGAFILMYLLGFTINIMTLLALSLAVGLLVDDAIVVRENIFRHLEEGRHPVEAAERGTMEVLAPVIATTLTVIAVFLPVGFLGGIVGQFFKQFGLTMVFAMIISLFDAVTMAPLLSAYFAGKKERKPNFMIRAFDRFQTKLEIYYEKIMKFSLRRPGVISLMALLVLIGSFFAISTVKSTFIPSNDSGDFMVSVELPPGTSLNGTAELVAEMEKKLYGIPEINLLSTTIGSTDGQPNVAVIGVQLLPPNQRKRDTSQIKEICRALMAPYKDANPRVNDYSAMGGVEYPFNLVLRHTNLDELEKYANTLVEKLKKIKDLADINIDYKGGKPEFQIELQPYLMQQVAVSPTIAGQELRYHVAGGVVGKLHENGLEYDLRMRLKPEQRNLKSSFQNTKVPNNQQKMIALSAISTGSDKLGPAKVSRQDRSRTITISANLAPQGAIDTATKMATEYIKKEIPELKGMTYAFIGQAENFKELQENMALAFGFAFLFIFLVLASQYESFFTPVTILIAIPFAISGAFFALAITREMMSLFSMIGLVMLMGLVTKNSILLVDLALKKVRSGMDRSQAIFEAGRTRLRPILMTSFALIAGTLPIAMGVGEASKSRTGMGVAIIGGVILSTFLTLIVVPAFFSYIDRFREFVESKFRPDYDMRKVGKLTYTDEDEIDHSHASAVETTKPAVQKTTKRKSKKES